MRSAVSYHYGHTLRRGSTPWRRENNDVYIGNPSLSTEVTSYMRALRRKKVRFFEALGSLITSFTDPCWRGIWKRTRNNRGSSSSALYSKRGVWGQQSASNARKRRGRIETLGRRSTKANDVVYVCNCFSLSLTSRWVATYYASPPRNGRRKIWRSQFKPSVSKDASKWQ